MKLTMPSPKKQVSKSGASPRSLMASNALDHQHAAFVDQSLHQDGLLRQQSSNIGEGLTKACMPKHIQLSRGSQPFFHNAQQNTRSPGKIIYKGFGALSPKNGIGNKTTNLKSAHHRDQLPSAVQISPSGNSVAGLLQEQSDYNANNSQQKYLCFVGQSKMQDRSAFQQKGQAVGRDNARSLSKRSLVLSGLSSCSIGHHGRANSNTGVCFSTTKHRSVVEAISSVGVNGQEDEFALCKKVMTNFHQHQPNSLVSESTPRQQFVVSAHGMHATQVLDVDQPTKNFCEQHSETKQKNFLNSSTCVSNSTHLKAKEDKRLESLSLKKATAAQALSTTRNSHQASAGKTTLRREAQSSTNEVVILPLSNHESCSATIQKDQVQASQCQMRSRIPAGSEASTTTQSSNHGSSELIASSDEHGVERTAHEMQLSSPRHLNPMIRCNTETDPSSGRQRPPIDNSSRTVALKRHGQQQIASESYRQAQQSQQAMAEMILSSRRTLSLSNTLESEIERVRQNYQTRNNLPEESTKLDAKTIAKISKQQEILLMQQQRSFAHQESQNLRAYKMHERELLRQAEADLIAKEYLSSPTKRFHQIRSSQELTSQPNETLMEQAKVHIVDQAINADGCLPNGTEDACSQPCLVDSTTRDGDSSSQKKSKKERSHNGSRSGTSGNPKRTSNSRGSFSLQPPLLRAVNVSSQQKMDPVLMRKVQANPQILYKHVPNVSAKYWAIFDNHKQQFIHGKREYVKREVASLTKMMTAYTVIEIAKQYKVKLSETKIRICSIASNIRGTTAFLKQGDTFTAEQLMYGMMLPSGNDAAFALAKHFGKMLFNKKGYTDADMQKIRSYQFNYHPYFVKYFLKQMNEYAAHLKLQNTHFDSPHGLMNIQNLSTAYDMAKLQTKCMQIPMFRRIVGTQLYTCQCLTQNSTSGTLQDSQPIQLTKSRQSMENWLDVADSGSESEVTTAAITTSESQSALADQNLSQGAEMSTFNTNQHRLQQAEAVGMDGTIQSKGVRKPVEAHPDHSCFEWLNTNKLLDVKGFNGCKTGITEAAGPCLAAAFDKDGHSFSVIILQSKSMDARWQEVIRLVEWAINRKILLKPASSISSISYLSPIFHQHNHSSHQVDDLGKSGPLRSSRQ